MTNELVNFLLIFKFNTLTGKYKVEIFDTAQNKFIPTTSGLGMHVEVKDPEEKIMLSRVCADVLVHCLHVY